MIRAQLVRLDAADML